MMRKPEDADTDFKWIMTKGVRLSEGKTLPSKPHPWSRRWTDVVEASLFWLAIVAAIILPHNR